MGPRLAAAAIGCALLAGSAGAAEAPRPCSCEARDGLHPVGAVVCLSIGGEDRLARCERVLNNTSWRILGDSCPTAATGRGRPAG